MLYKVVVVCVALVLAFICGCGGNEPVAEIVYDYPTQGTSPVRPVPTPSRIMPSYEPSAPSGWMPLSWMPERGWTAIVIHHSASRTGNASIFDNWHREGRGWNGVGYDFVIGNGTDSSDGQVEITKRWRYQEVGAHCGGTPGNWANKEAVGICLVGDFNQSTPTRAQMQSLVKLVNFLQSRYNISKSRIYGHGTTPGGHNTDCPGRRFPMAELKSMLD